MRANIEIQTDLPQDRFLEWLKEAKLCIHGGHMRLESIYFTEVQFLDIDSDIPDAESLLPAPEEVSS